MNEFIKDGENILVNAEYAEAYIPYDLVGDNEKGRPTAYRYGEGIRCIGVFNMKFFDSEEDIANRDAKKVRTFNYPNEITMYPSNQDVMTLQLSSDMNPEKYLVLGFRKRDIMMKSRIQKNSKNCEAFLDFLFKGKLPKGLSYTDLYFSWIKNFQINATNPGVPAITLQLILSENCRSAADPMKQFRKVSEEPGVSMTDYRVHNMVDICSNSSVMNSLIFERFGQMLSYAINMSKDKGTKQSISPLEDVLSM